jgi:diphthine-ammonia ligase
MQVVALISGGKDSSFNIIKCIEQGHQVIALANLYPQNGTEELDSYMYQSVGSNVIEMISECYGLPLYRRPITGTAVTQLMDYIPTDGDEVEDLFLLLQDILKIHPDIKGVSSGAIFSTYQKNRVEQVCSRLGLTSLAYLWQREQLSLLDEMINAGIHAVLIKTAAYGLGKQHLGKSLSGMREELKDLSERYGLNACGEGGEYETLTLDSPLYAKGRLELSLNDSEIVVHNNAGSVVYLKPQVKFVPK